MSQLSEFQSDFLQYMKANSFSKAPEGLYEPVDYILQLGGKRLRPVLVLMGYQLFEANYKAALPLSMAVEVFHNFSLVHDDIMDAAPLRRGKPTVHQHYGLNTGILSGDVMLILCYEYLLKVEKKHLVADLVAVFNEMAIKVCEGQQYDMDFETRQDVTIPSYLMMIEYKTAALIECSLALGGILAEAGSDNIKHLRAFGRNIGLAFQMQDDILDTFGDPEKFGKKVGGDILNNKKTFLVLKAMELATEEDQENLAAWMRTTTEVDEEEKITAVRALFRKWQVHELAMKKMDQYQQTAFEQLNQVQAPAAKKQILFDLADQLLVREV